jgi:hypothetical protein
LFVQVAADGKGNCDDKSRAVNIPGELRSIVDFQLAAKFFGGGDKSHYRYGIRRLSPICRYPWRLKGSSLSLKT